MRRIRRTQISLAAFFAVIAVCTAACSPGGSPQTSPAAANPPPAESPSAQTPVERGAYLVSILGCHDCHSPKIYGEKGPEPDPSRLLSGQPADKPLPSTPAGLPDPNGWVALTNSHFTAWLGPWGVSFASNLTPDATGLGGWTEENFIQTIRTGKHLGVGRPILPPMPWQDFAKMTDEDLRAVFAYLRTLPPVANVVPAPLPPAGS